MVAPLPTVTESPREIEIQLSDDGSGAPDRNRSLAIVTLWPMKQFSPIVTFSQMNVRK